MTFENQELVNHECRRRELQVQSFEFFCLLGFTTLPPRQRDVRMEGSPFGLETGLDAGAIDPGRQVSDRPSRLDSRPQGSAAPTLEPAQPLDSQREWRVPDPAEPVGDVVRERSFNLTDETKRQVKLLVSYPA
jgi:hypothetical protein